METLISPSPPFNSHSSFLPIAFVHLALHLHLRFAPLLLTAPRLHWIGQEEEEYGSWVVHERRRKTREEISRLYIPDVIFRSGNMFRNTHFKKNNLYSRFFGR